MIKYYYIGGYKFKLEELPTGEYKLTTKCWIGRSSDGEMVTDKVCKDVNEAYKEIVSYSEIDEDDWEN